MLIPARYILALVVATLAALPGFALGRGTVAYPATVQTAFSPGGGAPRLVIAAIDRARARVLVAIYSFSHSEIAKALVAAKRRGVDVAVVMDADQAGRRYSGAQFLANQGVPVFLVNRYQAMHHKFAVIDSDQVLLGSFNWTRAAEQKNAENVNLITSAEVAQVYVSEFYRLEGEGGRLPPRY